MRNIIHTIANHLRELRRNDNRGLIFLSIFMVAVTLFIISEVVLPMPTKTISQKIVGYVKEKIQEIPLDIITRMNVATSTVKQAPVVKSTILQAKSAYVYDMTNKKTYFDLHSELIYPLASLTKIMTAIVVAENLNTNEVITVDQGMLLGTPENSDLTIGEKWKIGDLLKFMLITSSNDTANLFGVVAKREGKDLVSLMNIKSKKIGLTNTFFINETGLDETTVTGGSYGTAKDVAILIQYALKNYPEYFEPTSNKAYNLTSESGVVHHINSTSQEISAINGITASKTGLTSLAGGNLAFIFNTTLGHEIVVSLLGSTKDGRFSDAEILSGYAIQALKNNQ